MNVESHAHDSSRKGHRWDRFCVGRSSDLGTGALQGSQTNTNFERLGGDSKYIVSNSTFKEEEDVGVGSFPQHRSKGNPGALFGASFHSGGPKPAHDNALARYPRAPHGPHPQPEGCGEVSASRGLAAIDCLCCWSVPALAVAALSLTERAALSLTEPRASIADWGAGVRSSVERFDLVD